MHDGHPVAALLRLKLEWAELGLTGETLSASRDTAGKHVGTLEFFDAFSHSRRKSAYSERKTLQKAYLGENNSTPSGDIERHHGPDRALPVQKRQVLQQDVPPPAAQRFDVARSKFEGCLRVQNTLGAKELVSHGFDDTHNADLCAVRRSVTSWPPLAVQGLCSNVFIVYQFKPHPWIV